MPFHFHLDKKLFDVLQMHEGMIASEPLLRQWGIGPGEMCYVVGLFRLMAGEKRNLPIVHMGNIAAMSGDEAIPVQDWLAAESTSAIRRVNGYLVEVSNLKGLSGSPVLVRPDVVLGDHKVMEKHSVRAYTSSVFLLGVWQSSWDAKPDEVVAVEKGNPIRVPVGMGVVVPVAKLMEILDSEPVTREREQFMLEFDAKVAAGLKLDTFYRRD
jgi:hypothetical protein